MKKFLLISIFSFQTLMTVGQTLTGDWTFKTTSVVDENFHIDTVFLNLNAITFKRFIIDRDTSLSILTLSENSNFDFCSFVTVTKPEEISENGKKSIIHMKIFENCLSQFNKTTWRYNCSDFTITFYLDDLSFEGTGLSEKDFEKLNFKEKKIVFRVDKFDEEELSLTKLSETNK